ncbi:MAG: DNA polymerase ligase N-terminal domain-containing protein [Bacillota bacterium]
MSKNKSLDNYNKKRDFKNTDEPKGKKNKKSNKSIFVIQKHDASSLHYDFRIEVDGVLKSWAIPKGPSTDPSEKRLAIPTEDHPLDYADFEGVIPEDNYGAGTVMVWDKGTYKNITTKDEKKVPIKKALDKGHITIYLSGEKLKGGYALIRTNYNEEEQWLFIKTKDDEADARRNPTSTEPKSVLSNKTISEIEEDSNE